MRKLITAICLFIAANSMLCRVLGVTSVFALAVAEDSKGQYNLRSPYASTFDSSIIVNGYIIMMNPTALAGSVPSYIVVLDSATKSLKYIPTTLMMTAARAQSSIDSITASINLRRLISDSSAWHEQLINKYPLSGNPSGFISSYTETDGLSFHITDTATAFGRYARLQRVLDSLAAVQSRLNTYQVSGSYATTTQLGLKVNISDTSAMLSPYGLKTFNGSTYATITNLALKNNISDTASMLSNYAKTSAVNLKLNITDTTGFRTYSNFLYLTSASLSGYTQSTRTVSTTSPLTGGGDLSANRTFAINNASADSSTKGAAAFATDYFNDNGSGLISYGVTSGTGTVSASAVTINTPRGKITLSSPSILAGTTLSVTFTNSYINSTSTINVGMNGNGSSLTLGANCYIKSQTAGSCVINILNLSLLSTFTSSVVIDYFIVN